MVDLKEIRTKKNITQKKLADIVGVKRVTITNIENGINKPSISTAKKLGDYFGFDWKIFFSD